MTILIADDDELMLKILEFRLKKDGYSILLAKDGLQARQLIEEHKPNLVVTDLMMPYSSGMEVTSFVKEKYKDAIQVIILSGMGQENVVLEAFRLGADDYITKPFSPNELSVRVNRLRQK